MLQGPLLLIVGIYLLIFCESFVVIDIVRYVILLAVIIPLFLLFFLLLLLHHLLLFINVLYIFDNDGVNIHISRVVVGFFSFFDFFVFVFSFFVFFLFVFLVFLPFLLEPFWSCLLFITCCFGDAFIVVIMVSSFNFAITSFDTNDIDSVITDTLLLLLFWFVIVLFIFTILFLIRWIIIPSPLFVADIFLLLLSRIISVMNILLL